MQFINAHNVPYTPSNWLSFDDVLLIPKESDLESRNDPRIQLNTKFTSNLDLRIPLISANMDTVTGAKMVKAIGSKGGFGILHRFYESPETYLADISEVIDAFNIVAFSVGAAANELNFVEEVLKKTQAQHYIVCVDVAHGHLRKCIQQVRNLRKAFGTNVQIIAGNVCTASATADLVYAGVNAVKVGVGPGSHCTTREVTGHGLPQLSAIMQCRMALNGLVKSNVALIADGGIRTSGDIIKALAAGADSVMIGRLFAATQESPGVLFQQFPGGAYRAEYSEISKEYISYKKYRGQSSQDFLNSIGKTGVTSEGESSYIKYRGSVIPIIDSLVQGIRSGLSYAGCPDLTKLSEYATFIEISQNAHIEGTPHGVE